MKLYLYLGLASATLLFIGGVAVKFYSAGFAACERQVIVETIVKKEEINEIRNNRPADDQLDGILRKGSF